MIYVIIIPVQYGISPLNFFFLFNADNFSNFKAEIIVLNFLFFLIS